MDETSNNRPLPSLEDFAKFLFDRPDSDAADAGHAQRRLMTEYAAIWSKYEGVSLAAAMALAHDLCDAGRCEREPQDDGALEPREVYGAGR